MNTEELTYIQEPLRSFAVPIESVIAPNVTVRKHSKSALDVLVSSLRKFGQMKPLVLDNNGVCRAGNLMLLAFKKLGYKYIAAVKTNLTAEEAEKYEVLDNRSGEAEVGSNWDYGNLNSLMDQLKDKFDTSLFDWRAREIKKMPALEKPVKRKSTREKWKRVIRCPKCGEPVVEEQSSENKEQV